MEVSSERIKRKLQSMVKSKISHKKLFVVCCRTCWMVTNCMSRKSRSKQLFPNISRSQTCLISPPHGPGRFWSHSDLKAKKCEKVAQSILHLLPLLKTLVPELNNPLPNWFLLPFSLSGAKDSAFLPPSGTSIASRCRCRRALHIWPRQRTVVKGNQHGDIHCPTAERLLSLL